MNKSRSINEMPRPANLEPAERRTQETRPARRMTPFAGQYDLTFQVNLFRCATDGRPLIVTLPAEGQGRADRLGPSTIYAGQMLDMTQTPPRSELNLVFRTQAGDELYARGWMHYLTLCLDGRSMFEGLLLIDGGTGCYAEARGQAALSGVLDRTTGAGSLTFIGTLAAAL